CQSLSLHLFFFFVYHTTSSQLYTLSLHDALPIYSLFTLISGSVSHEARNQLFYLLGHRELTHSVFFAVILAVLIWIKTRDRTYRSEEHTSELQSRENLVCRLLLEKKKKNKV